jgi:phosphate transport system protein
MARLFKSAQEPAKLEISDIGITPQLRQQTVQVFALVGEAIAGATHALLANDRELAKRIVDQDVTIDNLVDSMVNTAQTRLLEERSLGADSKRMLMTLIRILPDIERNGDLAEHIARRAARGLGNEMSPRSRGLVERMGEVASMIWREATDIIIDGKLGSLGEIEDIDDELDDLHVSLTAELTSGSMALPVAVELALLARFYERFGDHCVNLARRQVGRDGAD